MSSLVAGLVDALERGTDAFTHHPYESAEYREAHARLQALLEQAWSEDDRVYLPVDEGSVIGDSDPPGHEPQSFARRLARCGVTSVTLLPGAERREVIAFLQVVHRAARAGSGESADLGSLLSQLGLQHIRCEFRELAPVDTAPQIGPPSAEGHASPGAIRARIAADAASAPKPEIVDIESFDSTLHFLDESEIAYLKDEIEREYAQNLGKNVTALLMDTLESRTEPQVRSEVIRVLEKLLPRLLQEGNFEAAVYLVTEVDRAMGTGIEFDTVHRKALFALMAKLSSAEALGQLVQALDGAQGPPAATELAALLANFTPRALGSVLKWLSRAPTTDTATLVSAAVEQVVAARPSALVHALESSDTAVVAQALRLFRKSPSRESLSPVIELASSPDAAVRLQVVDALLAAGSARGCVVLTKLIEDEDAEVRTAALRAVSVRGWDKALAPIREAIEAKDIVGRGISEQRAFFEAYGTLAGTGGIEVLRPILLGKTRSAKKSPELRACAAVGLSQIEHPAARKLLLAAVKDRNPVVKAAASQALYG